MFAVRAVVLHLSHATFEEGWERVEDLTYRLLDVKNEVERDLGVTVNTVRLVLPPLLDVNPADLAKKLSERKPALVMASIGNVPASHSKLEEAVSEAVKQDLTVGVLLDAHDWDTALRVSRAIHKVADEDLNFATRVGINTLGEPIVTPYFPLAYSPGDHDFVTVSLLYPNYLLEAYQRGGLEELENAVLRAGRIAIDVAERAAKLLKAEVGGVDLSVSPWMSESSLGLTEAVAGVRMPKAGYAWGVRLVNDVLERATKNIPSLGYNEVQLPVAEDSRLKLRVVESGVTARDLARLSGVCLAGLDMAAVPADVEGVAGLVLEVAAYSKTKKKALGVRVIPVSGLEPGDKVALKLFGETPVIPI
ncbi:MAG: DUF711 family protein [Acidilobaceae archaeon]